MKNTIAALTLVAISAGMSCAHASQDYDFLQVQGVVKSEYSDIDQFGLTGLEVRGSKRWHNMFGEFRYRDLSDTDNGIKLEENRWSTSLGYIMPFSDNLHFDIRANYGNIEAELSNQNEQVGFDINYYGVSGFTHYSVTEEINIYGGLEYQSLKDAPDQKAYHLGASYSFEMLSVGAEYVKYSDSDALSLFLRYSF